MKKIIVGTLKFIRKIISQCILFIMFWRIKGTFPDISKYVVVLAPHKKGFFEIILGLLVAWSTNLQPQFVMVKYEAFKPKIRGWFLKKIGAMPIDRKREFTNTPRHSYYITAVSEIIRSKDNVAYVITPEGTRIKEGEPLPEWKKGFYFIASEAEVPIVMVALDYKKRQVIINPEALYPSSNMIDGHRSDIRIIWWWFREVIPGYEPNINVTVFNRRSGDVDLL